VTGPHQLAGPAETQRPGQAVAGTGPAPADPPRETVSEPAEQAGLAIATRALAMRFAGGFRPGRRTGGQLAVDHIDLAVPQGSVYGFLGPNGSGKTTTIRMLLGLMHPTFGSFRLLGAEPGHGLDAVLPRVGALVEGPAFYPFLTGAQNLARCDAADRTAEIRTASFRIDAALDQVGLLAAADKKYRAYSLGMKQRLGIAAALLRPRELMILDEPTNGLDPQGTREIRSLIKQIAADGTTVFVSSHLLAEVEQICSHVGVMSTGKLVFQGTLGELRSRGEPRIRVLTAEPARAAGVLAGLGLTEIAEGDGEVSAALRDQKPERINAELVHAGIGVAGLQTLRPSLEDLFVELTGEGFNVGG
jgi:ABC-2 type transport system ATP-binding protein